MTRPSHDPLAPGVARTPSGSFEGWVLYAPRNEWLHLLAQGWKFSGHVVDVMRGHHGHYAVLLWRDDESNGL